MPFECRSPKIMSPSEHDYYAVIEFSDGLQLIPSNWLNEDMSMARWPTLTNVQRYEKAIRNMEPPKELWTNIPVIKIIAKDSSYEKAKAKLKDAELLTDFDNDSDARADKSKRSRKKRARMSNSSSDEEEFNGTEVQLDPFPHPPQTINSKTPINIYKAKKEKAVLIKNGNQRLAINDTTPQITNDIPVFNKSPCTSQSIPAKKKLPNEPSYASNNGSINSQDTLSNKYARKNTEFARNQNSPGTVVRHIHSHAAENQATNVITSEPTLNIDDNIIFDFPEFEQQKENASPLIDYSPISHIFNNNQSVNVFQRFVVRSLTNIKFDIQNLQREIKTIRKESFATLNRKFEDDLLEEEKENVLINLPLKTIDGDLRELEENLTNKEFRSQVIKELLQTGGKTLKHMSLQLMRKLFSDDLAEQFSWVGGKKKEVFSDLRICKAILYVVGKRFTGATENDIAAPIKTWLAHAKERANSAKNKKKVN
ncbi:uncharacterized protein [Linepithema humile]|uniref:uncharacterized protein isoform X3 n=1 Tax=Linepithema humile TaxID=83485 RepID=UPI00351F7D0E